jgi:hypothetical protein
MKRKDVAMDPAVAAVLGDGRRRQRERGMTRAQRRQAARDARRQRVTYEIDPRIARLIGQVAEAEGVSPAGVVNRLMADALDRYAAGGIVFYGWRRESRGPRYEWVVELRGMGGVEHAVQERITDRVGETDG